MFAILCRADGLHDRPITLGPRDNEKQVYRDYVKLCPASFRCMVACLRHCGNVSLQIFVSLRQKFIFNYPHVLLFISMNTETEFHIRHNYAWSKLPLNVRQVLLTDISGIRPL